MNNDDVGDLGSLRPDRWRSFFVYIVLGDVYTHVSFRRRLGHLVSIISKRTQFRLDDVSCRHNQRSLCVVFPRLIDTGIPITSHVFLSGTVFFKCCRLLVYMRSSTVVLHDCGDIGREMPLTVASCLSIPLS